MGLGSRAQRHLHLKTPLTPHTQPNHARHSTMSPEEFISRIMEAEPPEIYLMEDLKKPFTETSMMMSLTNLADKELVLMISWAKKIPGKRATGWKPALFVWSLRLSRSSPVLAAVHPRRLGTFGTC